MRAYLSFLLLVFGMIVFPIELMAQSRTNDISYGSDPRGDAEITLCSQNLENYGSLPDSKTRNPGLTEDAFAEKERALVRRIGRAGCDVVAVQEVLGKTDEAAELALTRLAGSLKATLGRTYVTKVGPTLDKFSHLGYLVAADRAEIMTHVAYGKIELPKLTDKEKPRLFVRAPLELQILVKPLPGGVPRTIGLINIHFKSRRGGAGDPAALEWETYRMQMAEAIRRIAENRYSKAFTSSEMILVILGDRNSNFDQASAKILEGSLKLDSFTQNAGCRLSKRGVPLCQVGSQFPQKLFSVLTLDPQVKLQSGTHTYKGEYSWLDEILLPAESLRYAWKEFDSVGRFNSGVVYDPKLASDHALVYVRLNW